MNQLLFSVIIPTYNRPQQLANCLQSFTHLEYPRDRFEVIVVDDGSKTPLDELVSPFNTQFEVKLFRQNNSGPATARNTGARQAKHPFLAFTDDDCMPSPTWLKSLAARFAEAPNCLIGGRTINALPHNLYSSASQQLIDYVYEYYNAKPPGASFFASNNIALPAQLFLDVGGFDTSFPLAAAEDREFCDRWLARGYQMLYAPEAQIHHAHHLSLQSFWRQHFFYGRGAFCFHQVRAERASEQVSVEPLSFYANLLAHPLSQAQGRSLAVAALLGLSQVANAAGFFWEMSQGAKSS